MKFFLIFFTTLIFSPLTAFANPEGYDVYSGSYVEFDEECFHEGDSFYMFDYADGEYHLIDINEMNGYNNGDQIEIYDYDNAEFRSIDLEENIC